MMEDLILFQTAEEFQQRPGYQSDLTCTSDELDRIVGKYQFSKEQELECGLNGCHTKHWHGYVISTRDGRETNCGQDCGKREFGVDFEQLEAKARRQEQAQRRRQLLKAIMEDQGKLLDEAKALQNQCMPWQRRIFDLVKSLEREPEFYKSFKAALRDDGRIRVAAKSASLVADATGKRQSKQDIQTLATIAGGAAFRGHLEISRDIQQKVINPLVALGNADLASIDDKALATLSKTFDERKRVLHAATEFMKNAQVFFSPENLKRLPLLKETLPKRHHSSRLNRILDGLIEQSGA